MRLTVLVDEADADLPQAVAASGRRSLTSYLRLVLAAHAEMVRGGPAAGRPAL